MATEDVLPVDIRATTVRVVDAVASVAGVQAVVLGGSWASGTAGPDSDVDLGLFYDGRRPFSPAALEQVVSTLDDAGAAATVTPFGAWGPFIDGGAWLTVEGRRVDLLYRDVERLRRAVADGAAGRAATHYQPGHPHGFRTDIHLAELVVARPLRDPTGLLDDLRAPLRPYPEALRREIVRAAVWEAGFSLGVAEGAAARADVHHVVGCLYRAVTCLALALLAHARVWCANEKGALRLAAGTPAAPPGFAERLEGVLAAPGASPVALARSLGTVDSELARVREVVADLD